MTRVTIVGIVAGVLLGTSPTTGVDAREDIVDVTQATQRRRAIDPRKSLAVTDHAILAKFSLSRVMKQLVDQAYVPGMSELLLFQRWWDTQNPRPGHAAGAEHHCDDFMVVDPGSGFLVTALNGYPYDCRPDPSEGAEAVRDPFAYEADNADAYVPIGLFSRFDLARVDGAHCGEYRIVYARRSGMADNTLRNLIIFEATLPNPSPEKAFEGCQPIAGFWSRLTQKNVLERAAALERFYFRGLRERGRDGTIVEIGPVVDVDNYGNDPARGGQIRTNQFMSGTVNGSPVWTLREFKLTRTCARFHCHALTFVPVAVKGNPFGPLFNSMAGWPAAVMFENWFTSNLDGLLGHDLTSLTLPDPGIFNAGQSDSSGSAENRYLVQLGSEPSRFRDAIEARLTTAHSTLTADEVVLRAQTQSCAGCHRLNDGVDIGGGLTWPASLGFVHVTERESEEGPDGPRFKISRALTDVFLPRRQEILQAFLDGYHRPRRPGQKTLSGAQTH